MTKTKLTMITIRAATRRVTTFVNLPVDERGKAYCNMQLIDCILRNNNIQSDRGATITIG